MRRSYLVVALALCTGSGTAHGEETWRLRLEAPAAVPLTQPQRSLFAPGGMPSIALFRRTSSSLWAGARLRAGLLPDGGSPADPMLVDPGVGGLMSATLGMRWSDGDGTGPWVELGGGAAMTGPLLRGTAEAGAGWAFQLGSVSLGPSLRYVHVHHSNDELDSRDAGLALIGFEIGPAPSRPRVAASLVERVPPPPPLPRVELDLEVPDATRQAPSDRDGDGIPDAEDACPDEREVVNGIDDADGCPDEGLIELIDDRIILEERVLFDLERARVRRGARPALMAIVELWRQNPDWERMVIEGHADVRGSDEFNQWLSEERARRVKAALVELGVPEHRVQTFGYGKSAPRDDSGTEEGHQRNRRVEFVIVRGVEVRQ